MEVGLDGHIVSAVLVLENVTSQRPDQVPKLRLPRNKYKVGFDALPTRPAYPGTLLRLLAKACSGE